MSQIEFRDVSKRYADGTEAVRKLNLEIEHGELMVLVGPSGCGKTTALRMIAGLEDISDGQLRIGDQVVNERAPKERDIAMVFQNYALYPHMTVRENMGFALRLAKVDRKEIARRVEEAARMLDLEDHLERRPARLSGGQRQRVAMGRALVRQPQAFLMDEPLSNLDAKLRVEMRAQVSRLQARLDTTTVYVTHDQTEAMTLGDRLAVMRGGVLQQVGSPRELYERPANIFVAGFIGSPAMNFFEGELSDDGVRTPIGELPLASPRRGARGGARRVIVGVRPEHFEDATLVEQGAPGHVFDVAVELAESVGSDLYAHFAVAASELRLDGLAPTAGEAPTVTDGTRIVARLQPASQAQAGQRHRLWLDTAKVQLFDPETGSRLEPLTAEAV